MTPQDLIQALQQGVSLDELLTPGLRFVLVEHEPHCPGAQGSPADCCCSATIRTVNEAEYMAAMNAKQAQGRAARRAAERAVAKAKRKAGSK